MQTRQWWSWQSYCQQQTTLSPSMLSMMRIPVTLSLLLLPHVRHSEIPKCSYPEFFVYIFTFTFSYFPPLSFICPFLISLEFTLLFISYRSPLLTTLSSSFHHPHISLVSLFASLQSLSHLLQAFIFQWSPTVH